MKKYDDVHAALVGWLIADHLPILEDIRDVNDADLTQMTGLTGVPRGAQWALILAGAKLHGSPGPLDLVGATADLGIPEGQWPTDKTKATLVIQNQILRLAFHDSVKTWEGRAHYFNVGSAAWPVTARLAE